jgi:hypothetical protein
MKILTYQEVVPWPLADDAEVVREGNLEPYLAVELALSHSCRLILVSGIHPCATYSLWLEVSLSMEPATTITRNVAQHVEVTTEYYDFPCTSICAGNKHLDIDRNLNVLCECSGLRPNWRCLDWAH